MQRETERPSGEFILTVEDHVVVFEFLPLLVPLGVLVQNHTHRFPEENTVSRFEPQDEGNGIHIKPSDLTILTKKGSHGYIYIRQ